VTRLPVTPQRLKALLAATGPADRH